jgi:sugar/nucleoside kinase (ribokinase family)
MKKPNPILTVGSIALDNLETIKGKKEKALGGSATYFAMAASHFTETRVVGVVGTDFTDDGHDIFNRKNINSNNIQIVEGETFAWGGKYADDFSSRDTLFTNLGVFENFKPKINPNHLNTPIVFLGNIHPELQMDVINQMSDDSLIITDTMNLWINISLNHLWDVIERTDILLLNDEEAEQLTGESNLKTAAELLLNKGPKTVIIKKGAKGSMICGETNLDDIPVFPGVDVSDPTGAGDSFAGGFCGYLAKFGTENLVDAIIYGSAIASFTVSQFSVDGLRNIKIDDIEERAEVISNLLSEKISID